MCSQSRAARLVYSIGSPQVRQILAETFVFLVTSSIRKISLDIFDPSTKNTQSSKASLLAFPQKPGIGLPHIRFASIKFGDAIFSISPGLDFASPTLFVTLNAGRQTFPHTQKSILYASKNPQN